MYSRLGKLETSVKSKESLSLIALDGFFSPTGARFRLENNTKIILDNGNTQS